MLARRPPPILRTTLAYRVTVVAGNRAKCQLAVGGRVGFEAKKNLSPQLKSTDGLLMVY